MKGKRSVEELLENVLERLERLENIIMSLSIDPVSSLAVELALTYTQPAYRAVRLAQKIVELERRLGRHDPISRVIIEVLVATDRPLSISQLTREIRRIRGSASRRIISSRLKELEKKGIVEIESAGNKRLVKLKKVRRDDEYKENAP